MSYALGEGELRTRLQNFGAFRVLVKGKFSGSIGFLLILRLSEKI